jgi:hypothetical protein
MILDVTGNLIINDFMRNKACKLPYPDHKKGCPNWNKKIGCPPNSPFVSEFIDLTRPHFFVLIEFDLKAHVQRMKEKHPGWSDRKCRCVLYWQQSALKKLKDEIDIFIHKHPDSRITYCPEAMGVNVICTARKLGIPIKTRPTNTVYKVALVGYYNTVYKVALVEIKTLREERNWEIEKKKGRLDG